MKTSHFIRGLFLACAFVYQTFFPEVSAGNPLRATADISILLTVRDNGTGIDTLMFGFDRTATRCIDSALGEMELPPRPPVGIFDARFTGPCMDQGLRRDFRQWFGGYVYQRDTFQVEFQPGDGGYPFHLSWQSGLESYFSSLKLVDHFGGILVNVDMLSSTSATVSAPFAALFIIAQSYGESSAGPPIVTTLDAYNITSSSAILNGTVGPNGALTHARFEWGTTTSYGNLTPDIELSIATGYKPITFDLPDLSPNTPYHFRARATNLFGTVYGDDRQFTTTSGGGGGGSGQISIPLDVRDHGGASRTLTFGFDISATRCIDLDLGEYEYPPKPPNGVFDARFTGLVSYPYDCLGQGMATNYLPFPSSAMPDTFQVDVQPGDGGYPFVFSWPPLNEFFTSIHLQDVFGGIIINRDMLVDSVAIISNPVSRVWIIATPRPPAPNHAPIVRTNEATDIMPFSATLNGTVNPNGSLTHAQFQWGPSTSYGNLTPMIDLASATTPKPISFNLTGLWPNASFHYRVKATNDSGTSYGADRFFTTRDTLGVGRPVALKFHGNNDYVDVPDNEALSAIGDHFTLEFWMRIDALPSGSQELIGKWGCGANEDDEYSVNIHPDGRLEFGVSGLANWYRLYSTAIPVGSWVHVAEVFDHTTSSYTLYINGQLNQSMSVPTGFTMDRNTGQPFRIGTYDLCFYPSFRGLVDEVRVWSVSRSQSEIFANMNASLAGNETGLRGYWRFDEGLGTIAHDATSNHNDGMLVNGPEWVPPPPPPPPEFRIPLSISDLTMPPRLPIYFGVDQRATRCIDPDLGEFELPPPPPIGNYDARFVDPSGPGECFGQGVNLDLRPVIICITEPCIQVDTYKVVFQPTGNRDPVTLSWPNLNGRYSGSVRLMDLFGGSTVNVDMKAQTSFVDTIDGLNALLIIAEGPILGPPPPPVGSVITLPASNVTQTSAQLNGLYIDDIVMPPRDFTDQVYFEWGTSTSYGHSTPPHDVWIFDSLLYSYTLNDLSPNIEYHYRAVLKRDYAPPAYGNDQVFVTLPFEPTEAPQLFSARDVPNDQGRRITLKWFASLLDDDLTYLQFYSIWRALPEGTASRITPTNPRNITIDFKGPAYRIINMGGRDYAWEWVGNMPAHRFTTYSFTAPTLYDSSATSDGIHYFLVSAQTVDPNEFYDSNILPGYSVDNEPPHPPRGLTATFDGGVVILRWNSSPDPDVKDYVVYRSAQPRITIGDIPPIGSTADTMYVDAGPFSGSVVYYAVCSRDVSGNLGTSDVQIVMAILGVIEVRDGVPMSFALYQNYPNPFNPRTTIDFDIATTGFITLKVYNTLGQEVASLVNNALPPGRYRVPFDASGLISGIYYYRIIVADQASGKASFTRTSKLVLVK